MLSSHEQTKKRCKLKVKSGEGDTYYDHEAGHNCILKRRGARASGVQCKKGGRRIECKVSRLMSSSLVDSACEQALHQGIGAGCGDQLGW
jgi:hypothetical protein